MHDHKSLHHTLNTKMSVPDLNHTSPSIPLLQPKDAEKLHWCGWLRYDAPGFLVPAVRLHLYAQDMSSIEYPKEPVVMGINDYDIHPERLTISEEMLHCFPFSVEGRKEMWKRWCAKQSELPPPPTDGAAPWWAGEGGAGWQVKQFFDFVTSQVDDVFGSLNLSMFPNTSKVDGWWLNIRDASALESVLWIAKHTVSEGLDTILRNSWEREKQLKKQPSQKGASDDTH